MYSDLPEQQSTNLQSDELVLEENFQILPETISQSTPTSNDVISFNHNVDNSETCTSTIQDDANILDASQTSEPNEEMTYVTETNERYANYLKWKEFLQKKFAEKGEREFNIHNFCADILDLLPENKAVKFDTLVQGMESSEVIRFFVSALHLANNENIQFLDIPTRGLANDHLKLKLLTKEKYEECFTDFQAPSEKGLEEKLAHFRSINISELQRNMDC